MIAPPKIALSIRQPWAHAIAAGWKDIENRSWRRDNPSLNLNIARQRIAIHASSQMTQDEYHSAREFMTRMGFDCPPPDQLVYGGVIGSVYFQGITRKSDSPWFVGPVGLMLKDAHMLPAPIPCAGSLGFFSWQEGGSLKAPLKWMRSAPALQEISRLL